VLHFALRRCLVVSTLLLPLALAAGSAAAAFPGAAEEAAFAALFREEAARIVPGLVELQLAASPAAPAEVARRGKSDLPALDALLASRGLEGLEPIFFQTAPPSGRFGDYRDRFFTARLDAATDLRATCLALMELPEVLTAWPVLRCELAATPLDIVDPNDTSFPAQYYLATNGGIGTLRAKGAWGHSRGDSSIVVAVCDTGVDLEHPDLAGPAPYLAGNLYTDWEEWDGANLVDDDGNGYLDDWRGWDFVNVGSGPYAGEDYAVEDNEPADFVGHGTNCAGCVSAICDNGEGIASIGWHLRVLPLRIGFAVEDGQGGMTGAAYSTTMASAFNYARIKGAQVVNLSFGSSYTPSLQTAVNACYSAGVIMVVAAGNDNSSDQDYLATTNKCIDVAATTGTDGKADFSNYGSWVDVAAPGVGILTTAIGGYVVTQGTSFSSPLTAGLVGQIYWQLHGGQRSQANAAAVLARLTETCDDLDALNPGYAGLLGAGRINAFQALGGGGCFAFPEGFAEIQEALDFARAGDSLLVRSSVTAAVSLINPTKALAILGGWSEGYTSRDPAAAPSTLAGNGIQPLFVLNTAGLGSDLVIDGFRLENGGGGSGYFPDLGRYGGAMLVSAGQPTLSHLVFADCDLSDEGVSGGGGLFVAGTTLALSSCRFENNSARRGGGLGLYNASVTLSDCAFIGNTATHATNPARRGGAVHLESGQLAGSALVFTGNTAADEGGAIYLGAGSSLDLSAADFADNVAGPAGGAIAASGPVTLATCTLADNSAAAGGAVHASGALTITGSAFSGNGSPALTQFGGALYGAPGAQLAVRSTSFRADEVSVQGAALYANGCSGHVRNCTVDAPAGLYVGAAIACSNASLDLRNCQFTHTVPGYPVFASGPSLPTAAYNNFFGNGAGDYLGISSSGGDTHADPLYADAAQGDFHLALDSPALDAGDPAILDADGGRSDIGAYGGPEGGAAQPAAPSELLVLTLGVRDWFVELDWADNEESDLAGYAVYRDLSADFQPTAAQRVALVAPPVSAWRDEVPDDSTVFYYKVCAYDADGYASGYSNEVSGTGEADTAAETPLPTRFALRGAHPNPFNPSTTLSFDLPAPAAVTLAIHDARGRCLRRVTLAGLPAGRHQWTWDGRDDGGRRAASGVYALHLAAGTWQGQLKLTLLK
jgi:predicted outer membrane repeat protein